MTTRARDNLILLAAVCLGVSFWAVSFGRELLGPPPVDRAVLGSLYGDGLVIPPKPTVDKDEYDARLRQLAGLPSAEAASAAPAGSLAALADPPPADPPTDPPPTEVDHPLWPVQAAYPELGAILPYKRIIAYYGNFYSTGMGVLGEYPEQTVIAKLEAEAAAWEAADPDTPVQTAIDYIAIVAQAGAGQDGLYRLRMPPAQIDRALDLAKKVDGIVILEVQAGLADLMGEIRSLEPYLKLPQVHLAIDPEFAMRRVGSRPGLRVGTVDGSEINQAIDYLTQLARGNGLPPKVLVVHRYTRDMLTNADQIVPQPEVQVVIDMDGWGTAPRKFSTYNSYIKTEPVQFTGFKIFYRNDTKQPGTRVLLPSEVLKLVPQPIFIQYQ